MPPLPVPPSVDRFLAEAHFAVVASLQPDGAPHTAVTWYDWEGERVLLNMDVTRVRLGHLREEPRVSLTVLDGSHPYRHNPLDGVVEDPPDDEALADIDRLALRYTGKPYRKRESPRVSAWMRVESWHGWDATGTRPEFHTG
jgi:PPOX class probable F420-dependent enzyme